MVWVELAEPFDYRFLPSGELQYRDRYGQYRIAGGVTPNGYHLFWDRLERLNRMVDKCPEGVPIHHLFVTSEIFAFEAEQCIQLSGIDPDCVAIEQQAWLLFTRTEADDERHPGPLQVLNTLPEARRPASGKGEPLTDRVKFLSAIAAQSDSLADAYAVASSEPAREVIQVMEERAWQSLDGKQKYEAKRDEWIVQRRKQLAQRSFLHQKAGHRTPPQAGES
ncbi:MAG: hypothetical protein ACFB0C_15685 [Leptolyngbyaceae cyanobacterium]